MYVGLEMVEGDLSVGEKGWEIVVVMGRLECRDRVV